MQETINHLGSKFLQFAWPMLWQSSLLIAIVFTLDLLFARKVRAAVRHALWLVVLVKLLLPPTLALPTGAAWWLGSMKPNAKPLVPNHFTVTYGDATTLPTLNNPAAPVAAPAPPRLSLSGWTLVTTVTVSAMLLVWLLVSWAQVIRLVRRASPANEFSHMFEEMRIQTGLRQRVRVKMVDGQMSPAVCGLFRPVILLPGLLAQRLSDGQMRAVLLHELIHVRRLDVWVNCAQALLQIVYWWHPLVWVANARIRRVREDAVDDAVMVALAPEAKIYAPTLLEVAKLAFRRPLISLGLIGIMESRSALRSRIERLLIFRAPRHPGLTLASLGGILLFSAVALPMGAGPAAGGSISGGTTDEQTATVNSAKPIVRQVLLVAEIYQLPDWDWSVKRIVGGLPLDFLPENPGGFSATASPETFSTIQTNLLKSHHSPVMRPRILTNSGMPAQFSVGNAGYETELDVRPTVNNGRIDLALRYHTTDRAASAQTTNGFSVNASLSDHGGLIFRVPNDPDTSVVFLRAEILTNTSSTGHQQPKPVNHEQGAGAQPEPKAMQTALDIINGTLENQTNLLYTRTFIINTNAFLANLAKRQLLPAAPLAGGSGQLILTALRNAFAEAGGDLLSPPGKSLFYSEGKSMFYVKATTSDLKIIESVLGKFQWPNYQIHLKARFIAVPNKGASTPFHFTSNEIQRTTNGFTAILSNQQTRDLLRDLASRPGTETFGEPEITFLSSRKVQMRATSVVTVVTNLAFHEDPAHPNATSSDSVTPETCTMETGPIFDAVTDVFDDGYTINLRATAMDTMFEGYAAAPKDVALQRATNSLGEVIDLPAVLPAFQAWSRSVNANLYDNQTLLLTLSPQKVNQMSFAAHDPVGEAAIVRHIDEAMKTAGNNNVLVLVTATLVDAAGSRVHSDAELQALPKAAPQPN